jgi:hypothetical protein
MQSLIALQNGQSPGASARYSSAINFGSRVWK